MRPISSADEAKLARTLELWQQFIAEVEAGYDLTIDDYTNDLSLRDILQEFLDALSHEPALPTYETLVQKVQELDELFIQATQEVKDPLLPPLGHKPPGFWWFRIPKRCGELLLEDLIAEGYLPVSESSGQDNSG